MRFTATRVFYRAIGEAVPPAPPPRCVAGHLRRAGHWHAHDPARFEAAVRPYLEGAVRAATRLIGSEDLGRDAAQEALLSLWNTPQRPTNLAAWLSRAARHRALHMQRTISRSRRHERVAAGNHPEGSRRHDPSRACERCELLGKIEAAIARLPEEQRQAFRLCELEERDYQEAARIAGVPVGTVRSRLSRARAALRQELAGSDEESAEAGNFQPGWN